MKMRARDSEEKDIIVKHAGENRISQQIWNIGCKMCRESQGSNPCSPV